MTQSVSVFAVLGPEKAGRAEVMDQTVKYVTEPVSVFAALGSEKAGREQLPEPTVT